MSRFDRRRLRIAVTAALCGGLVGSQSLALAAPAPALSSGASAPAPSQRGWVGENLPLQLPVKTPDDLKLKAAAERQYLIFNLLIRGKLAWDAGDYAAAAAQWESLLSINGVDPEVEKTVRPLVREARSRAARGPASASSSVSLTAVPERSPSGEAAGDGRGENATAAAAAAEAVPATTVSGKLSLSRGPTAGGAVVWLKRVGGETPRPAPSRGKVVTQRNKMFFPRVLAVTVGSKVAFRNEDPLYHNVFSLSRPNDFDTGLYKSGGSYEQTFRKAGAVQLLCNIHASMLAYVYVVDSPYFAQADGSGAFSIRGVPPGDYDLEVWHEAVSRNLKQRIAVTADGVRNLSFQLNSDRRPPTHVPDKSGKPRQAQLGY